MTIDESVNLESGFEGVKCKVEQISEKLQAECDSRGYHKVNDELKDDEGCLWCYACCTAISGNKSYRVIPQE